MPLTDFILVQKHFAKVDPKLASVLVTVQLDEWLEKRVGDDYYFHLTRNIIGQQLAGQAADAIFTRFQKLLNDQVEPDLVFKLDGQALRDVGLSWAKVKYVKDLAEKVITREVVLDNLADLDEKAVIAELTKVKGIGRWTAEMFLLFTLHREDVFSHGDLGLRNGFARLYGIERPTEEQIEQVVSRWSPYKSYGSIALWHYLDTLKKALK